MCSSEYQLTIVTVCRNAGESLQQTVRSVIACKAETQLRIQHLIIDGASTDGTANLLQEWQKKGIIETCISEPDSGIYDAMNKGINLAQGQALYFLNAGDLLTEAAALEACVIPIIQGQYAQVAAPVFTEKEGVRNITTPQYEYVYLRTPCCHQGYFATTSLYKKLGGYNDKNYRCLADADFMCRAYSEYGLPYFADKPVAIYPENGFSSNCPFDFLPEYIELTEKNRNHILQRCSTDKEYRDMVMGVLTDRCMELSRWQQAKAININTPATQLQAQLRALAGHTGNLLRKACLYWAAQYYIPLLLRGKTPNPREEKIMYWGRLICSMRPGNKYALPNGYPVRSLRASLMAKCRSLLSRG